MHKISSLVIAMYVIPGDIVQVTKTDFANLISCNKCVDTQCVHTLCSLILSSHILCSHMYHLHVEVIRYSCQVAKVISWVRSGIFPWWEKFSTLYQVDGENEDLVPC